MDSSVQSRRERDRERETVVKFSNLRNHFTVSRLIGLLSLLDWTIFSYGIGFYIWAIITCNFYLLAILAIFLPLKKILTGHLALIYKVVNQKWVELL